VRDAHLGKGYGKQMAQFFIKLAFEGYQQQTLTCINEIDVSFSTLSPD
jgi:RimJ/RimL family protein N-acetyltransferase